MTFDLFNQPETGYAWKTSLPAYHDNTTEKEVQRVQVLNAIKAGANNILQVCEMTGLPDKCVTGKIHLLIKSGDISYAEQTVNYKNRERKKIIYNN